MADSSIEIVIPKIIHIRGTEKAAIPSFLWLALWAIQASSENNLLSMSSPKIKNSDDFVEKDLFQAYKKKLKKFGVVTHAMREEKLGRELYLQFASDESENGTRPNEKYFAIYGLVSNGKFTWKCIYDATKQDETLLINLMLFLLKNHESPQAQFASYFITHIKNEQMIGANNKIINWLNDVTDESVDALFAILCHKDKKGHSLLEVIEYRMIYPYMHIGAIKTILTKNPDSSEVPRMFRLLSRVGPGRELEVINALETAPFSSSQDLKEIIFSLKESELEILFPGLSDLYRLLGTEQVIGKKNIPKLILEIYDHVQAALGKKNPHAAGVIRIIKEEPLTPELDTLIKNYEQSITHFYLIYKIVVLLAITQYHTWYKYEYSLSTFFGSEKPQRVAYPKGEYPEHVTEFRNFAIEISKLTKSSHENMSEIKEKNEDALKPAFFKNFSSRYPETQEFYEQAQIFLEKQVSVLQPQRAPGKG